MEPDIQSVLAKMKRSYLDQVKYIMGDDNTDYSRFSWGDARHLNFYVVKIYDAFAENLQRSIYLTFAIPSETNSIQLIDMLSQTHNYSFEQLRSNAKELQYLVQTQQIITDDQLLSVIASSLEKFPSSPTMSLSNLSEGLANWSQAFAEREFKYFQSNLVKNNQIEPFPLTQTKLFVDTYHFDSMLNTLNDNQFTDEFNQCLFAYQNEKWFLCAVGLGSCLEHLMLLTLTNYHKETQLGRNPTAKDYLKAFTRDPINLDARQQTLIDAQFRLRNSVDHHNSGITSKRICEILLDGISDVFREYYVPSAEIGQ